MQRTLETIGQEMGTDKSITSHNYLIFYSLFLNHLRDEKLNILEIGSFKGASAKMWLEFFPHAQLHVIDIDPNALSKLPSSDRIHPILGDQADIDFIVSTAVSIKPHLVIEDGSHCWPHQLICLKYILPTIHPSGLYIMEDTETSFGQEYQKTFSLNFETNPAEYVANLALKVNSRGFGFKNYSDEFEKYCIENLSSICFYGHTIALTKNQFFNTFS